jgi:hypothetical protein
MKLRPEMNSMQMMKELLGEKERKAYFCSKDCLAVFASRKGQELPVDQ